MNPRSPAISGEVREFRWGVRSTTSTGCEKGRVHAQGSSRVRKGESAARQDARRLDEALLVLGRFQ